MDSIVEAFLGLVLGAILMYWLYSFFNRKKRRELVEHQSTVILDKIKSVCKLVSVEGDFAEIYRYENIKGFMNILSSKKKALIVINAKVQVGYDLQKLKLRADTEKKKIILSGFPEPEVLSIEPDIQFYDIQSGLFNTFSPNDLTDLNQRAKEHIREKIPESGLMETAKKEALQAVLLVEKIVETIGWRLDYSALEISNREKQLLESE
ncbi:MAG: hypothetical protein CMH48_15430 [Muricauda sp.]|nr:DUF4230 domain-containing protein [Allomuricauda sp.]MAU26336.1 hypothetical protein [Allomuricauda sp.]MBC31766.1 hypothetical protein [Allomuricauda sp.]MBC32218.1 hypothetical protein [Allomuricauda sp.]|tara:strand:+ start:199 stop:822 length:624 start_codon:yes stop_codon:yes gene_type:complete